MARECFHLDTLPEVHLMAEDSGKRWNGWAVPMPRPSEMAQFLSLVYDRVGHDVFRDMLPDFMEAYGGRDPIEDEPITHMGITWVKAHG